MNLGVNGVIEEIKYKVKYKVPPPYIVGEEGYKE